MIKYVIIFIQLIGISIYQLFFGDVTASQKIPDKINAGEEVTVEITINKEDINGFAKVQQNLPAGFSAEVVESKGATFSFKENIVKFIWMALPADKSFVISYKLKPNVDIVGNFNIGGKFSFISDNERKNVDIPESSITISKSDVLASQETTPTNPTAEAPKTETTEVTPTNTENTTTTQPVADNKVIISADRKVEPVGDKYKVSLSIKQSNLNGFAKYTDVIPAGFNAVADVTEGGIFSFKDAEAKILWMAVPNKPEFTVSYILEPTAEAKGGNIEINGNLSYLENDATQKIILNATSFEHKGSAVAQTELATTTQQTETPKTTTTTPKVDTTPKTTETKSNEVAPKTTPTAEKTSKTEVTSTPSPEKGVTYKVQIGAGHQQVSKNYFASKFNVSESVSVENHEGWIKYIVGKFSEYKQARDKRNDVRNNIKTAFVTAYNQGNRITVQEALMISNQKWLQ